MKRSSLVLAIAALALTALAVPQGRLELEAKLAGTARRATGKAKWKVRDGRQLQAELEVEGEHLARNADYTITVGENEPISVTTNGLGSFEFSARYGSDRPIIAVGTEVTVEDDANNVVLMGAFKAR